MPRPLQYRAGSVIYFQGDVANSVNIVQAGKVSLAYQNIEDGEDVRDIVSPGEFFGVKSALGRYPREENAIALQDTSLLCFSVPEFETLAQANTRIILKMLKVFSNQLRRVHRQVSNLVKQSEEELKPEAGLFNVGAYYLKNKRCAQAKYVFSRYLTYYPSGANAAQAAKNLELAESGAAAMPQSVSRASGQVTPSSIPDPASFSQDSAPVIEETAKTYYDAVNMFTAEKYGEAFAVFKTLMDANVDPEYAAKSFYDAGRCLYFMNKYDECIKHFTGMITTFPKHPELGNSLFFMGQSYEKLGRKDQALTFYRKVITMSESEGDAARLKAKRALDALTGG
jgi:CRP-like cAMP-binding protein